MSADVLRLLAPVSGFVVPLADVPDPVFAQRMTGDGAAIDPLSAELLAPCDATVVQVHRAKHAVTLNANGLELILHVGIDTVALGGTGFTPQVAAGDRVRAGQVLVRFDPDVVAARAKSLVTPVLVSTMDAVSRIEVASGPVTAGRDVLLTVFHTGAAASPVATAPAPASTAATVHSEWLSIVADTGLHARPASVLASTARQFRAEVRLERGETSANVRSVVSVMALEVLGGDRVRVSASGDDAAEAVAAVRAALLHELAVPATEQAPSPPRTARAVVASSAPPVTGQGPLPTVFTGVAASPGSAVGPVFVWRRDTAEISRHGGDVASERRLLEAAVAAARRDLAALKERLHADAESERAEIFAAHAELLEDPDLLDAADAEVRAGSSAAWSWRAAFTSQAERVLALKNPLLAARAADLRDVGRRVLAHVVGRDDALGAVPAGAVLVAEELTPSDTVALDRNRVAAIATVMGSATSHASILARGLGIPAAAGLDPRILELAPGTRVVLDGDHGTLRHGLSVAEEQAVTAQLADAARARAAALAAAHEPAITTDGHRVEVAGNLGDAADAPRVADLGGEGVGLLRSEFVFLERRSAPDEAEQTAVYDRIVSALGPDRLLVVRTLDVGGDKPLSYLPMPAEENPMLGERGIRLSLAHPETLRTQVRAILRAASKGKVAVMFPMIATLAEFRAAKAIVEEERAALGAPPVQIGLMVETAAAALMADQFAKDADFFSVGTNDLTQYTLAMDRGHPRLAPMVDALHPAVLRLIDRTVVGAHASGRWVGVCGALAGDVAAVPVLVGLGVDELSVDLPLIPTVKARVRTLSISACRETARLALEAEDGAAIRALVAARHGGPGGWRLG
jgi:phosphocarrier protein FPr